jgi:hypothetical protein
MPERSNRDATSMSVLPTAQAASLPNRADGGPRRSLLQTISEELFE